MQKPRITEIKVRIDCNGCVRKIKKSLRGITGISNLYVNFPQQKLTIIGCADPEKLVKAIQKTRKNAIICSHTNKETTGEALPPEKETVPPAEEPKEPPEAKPPSEPTNATPNQSAHDSFTPKDNEEIHAIYHHAPDYGYRYAYGQSHGYSGEFGGEPPLQPPQWIYVSHSYNTYKPSSYVTEYAYPRSPPSYHSYYSRPGNYCMDHSIGNNGNDDIASIFTVPFRYVKHRIDAIDEEKHTCRYTFIEGDALMDKLDHITYDVKFEAYGYGGCVCKITSEYYTKENNVEIKEEDIEHGKDRAIGMYDVVEAYLLAHPRAYI